MTLLTREDIENVIVSENYITIVPKRVVHCTLTTESGFIVTGQAYNADPEKFEEELGRKIAYDIAFDKLWSHETYAAMKHAHENRV